MTPSLQAPKKEVSGLDRKKRPNPWIASKPKKTCYHEKPDFLYFRRIAAEQLRP